MAAKKRAKRSGSGNADNDIPQPIDEDGNLSVLVEMRYRPGGSGAMALGSARSMDVGGFSLDNEFEPVSLAAVGRADFNTGERSVASTPNETFVIRGTVDSDSQMELLARHPDVAGVWRDTPIAPFPGWSEPEPNLANNESMAACPIPPCDCSPGTPKGTMADVATYLKVDEVWAQGFRGAGMVVGVLDSGITALGRPVKSGETARRIPRVIGGWPTDDWGTESGKWGDHGNMCATDVLGMAPEAQLLDLRIAGSGGSPGTISRALQAFNWAISQHQATGTPQVLTNSWGIFQEDWDTTYARNPNHPFTRKVVEAIGEGILVLFAAGNCGDTCADNRCGTDTGPGKSIWGANGHPEVMTVGAVNKNEEFVGYSSRGPAALDPDKPDFCSITHFTGYNVSDSGTSAATPILAGAVALLKQRKPDALQSEIKSALRATAKNIGAPGFDQHSGAGIVQIKAAFDHLSPRFRATLVPAICRRTLVEPGCLRRTVVDPGCLRRTVVDPGCIRRTLAGPGCIRPTLVGPRCPRRTLAGPTCPRPTLSGPTCPRPTLAGPTCPRPTLSGPTCPRPTLGPTCPRPTLAPERCPRPTLVGPQCPGPRPTLTAACPRPSIACNFSPDEVPYAQGPQSYGYDDQFAAEAHVDAEVYGYSGGDYYDPYYDGQGHWVYVTDYEPMLYGQAHDPYGEYGSETDPEAAAYWAAVEQQALYDAAKDEYWDEEDWSEDDYTYRS